MAGMDLLATGLGLATPLLLGALGAILAERGGGNALSLEGQMLAGALAAAAVTGTLAGAGAAMLAGLAVAGLAAWVTIRWRADRLATGIGLNLLVVGLAGVLLPLLPAPLWGEPGVTGLTWLALLLVPLLAIGLGHSAAGLALRAAGENPAAAAAAGLRPARDRACGLLAGGLLGGLAGVALALQQNGEASGGMIGGIPVGHGYMALAAVIIGRWRPGRTLLVCLGLGCAQALLLRLGGTVAALAPSLLALLALALYGRAPGLPIGGRAATSSPMR